MRKPRSERDSRLHMARGRDGMETQPQKPLILHSFSSCLAGHTSLAGYQISTGRTPLSLSLSLSLSHTHTHTHTHAPWPSSAPVQPALQITFKLPPTSGLELSLLPFPVHLFLANSQAGSPFPRQLPDSCVCCRVTLEPLFTPCCPKSTVNLLWGMRWWEGGG